MTRRDELVKEQKTREMPSRSRVFMQCKFFGVATASDCGDVIYVSVSRGVWTNLLQNRSSETLPGTSVTTSEYTRGPKTMQFFLARCCVNALLRVFRSIGGTPNIVTRKVQICPKLTTHTNP